MMLQPGRRPTVKTRFSLELALTAEEQLRLLQVFQYLAERADGTALIARELADYLTGAGAEDDIAEERFEHLIGVDVPGFDIVAVPKGARIFDTDGSPNLRMVCQIIANVVPSVLPFEFSFALLDNVEHRFSGGLVVMTTTSAEIQTIDSMLARRDGHMLH